MQKYEKIVFIWYFIIATSVTYILSDCVISSDASKKQCNTSLLPTTECGIQGTEDTIKSGKEASIFDYPWYALLKYRVNGTKEEYNCGGALINERYVVTAAHCVTRRSDYKLISVRLGEHNLDTEIDCGKDETSDETSCAAPPVDFAIENDTVHLGYRSAQNGAAFNDIALLRLAQKVDNFTDYIKPICLPIVPEMLGKKFENETHYVAGFGMTEYDKRSNVKLKIKVQVLPNSKCSEYIYNSIRAEHICAGGNKEDTCRGDSGGPLMKQMEDGNWYLTGVVSFGKKDCGTNTKPGVYVRITKYVGWILDNMLP